METTLYFGGPIVTLEEPQYAQALVERGGRIAYVGDREEAERLAGPRARRVDLEGRALLPAFLDPHSHLLACAYARLQVPLGECAGWGEITDRLAKHVQERGVRPGEWVKGTGYDQNALAEGAAPDRFCLDRACPHNPVIIQHASGHAGVFNTLALERLGALDGDCGLERDGQGALTGRGEENPFLDLLSRVPMEGLEDVLRAFQGAQEEYASHGITTAQEGLLQPVMAPVYQEILRRGLLYLDVNAYVPPADYDRLRGQFAQGVSASPGTFQVAGMKIFLDGSPQGRTAWMRRPYAGSDDYRGYGTMTDEAVKQAMEKAAREETQLLAHCNGDAAAEQFLSCLEAVEESYPKLKDLRPVIVHGQLMGRDQLPKAAALGAMVSFFVAHVYHWGDVHVQNFGMERASCISPARSALEQGVPITFHQDAPVIQPDMLETVWCACNRVTSKGVKLGQEECISVLDALKAITVNAAYQYFQEDRKGTLAPGKCADLVVLSRDPLQTPKEELDQIQVLETWKDGERVYQK